MLCQNMQESKIGRRTANKKRIEDLRMKRVDKRTNPSTAKKPLGCNPQPHMQCIANKETAVFNAKAQMKYREC
jgi:hypothetical protein